MDSIIKTVSGAGGILLAALLIISFCLLVKAVKNHSKVLKETREENASTLITCEVIFMFLSQLIPVFGIGIFISWFVCFGYESKWFEEIDKRRLVSLTLMALAIFFFQAAVSAFFGWAILGLLNGTLHLMPDDLKG